MGCHGGWAERSCGLPTGLLPVRESFMGRVLDSQRLSEAEDSIAELIARIQPNEASGNRRKAIADYFQSLIGKCFFCQVFIFGSVPLKTYLPDGDIDLTVFSKNENLNDAWAGKVYQVIKGEEKNENAEFHVKEVQLIEAEVKVIKCLVEGIVVDISFKQIGGLGSLCFLEEMDHLINQDHLFKRSIILIKAWCYYESRILGAHRGLISTYALETLILYIFHVFDNSFTGPLEVLYRFLEFFSNFDWNNFCVSIWGPVPVHLLPEMAVMPQTKDNGELVHKFFLKSCSLFYDGLTDGQQSQSRSFVSKYFNVVDPLCIHNNLGRSVCKGNFLRICSAFTFGAKKLARLLDFPKENMISELSQFFMSTWERHGAGLHTNSSIPSMEHLQPSKAIQVGTSYTSRNISYLKEQNDDISEYPGVEHLADVGLSFYGASSHILRIINQHSKNISRHNTIRLVVFHTKNQEDYNSKVISKNPVHVRKMFDSAEPVTANKNDENLSSNYSNNIEEGDCRLQDELGMFCSAKARSLTGLINASEISSGESHIIVQKSDTHEALPVSERDCRSKSLASGVMSSQTVTSSDDSSCSRQSSSLQATVSNGAIHIYHDSAAFSSITTSLHGESESESQSQDSYNQYPAQENYIAPPKAGNYEVTINEASQMSDAGCFVSTGQVLPSNPQKREIVNSGVAPSAMYPTGPPVPFLAMLQTYNFSSFRSCYGGLYGKFDDEALNCDNTAYNGIVDSGGMFDQHEIHVTATEMGNASPQAHAKPDLPRGWPSQNIPFLVPSSYPYPIAVPMVYFQGFFPPLGPTRSFLSQGSQFVPATHIRPETQIRTANILTFGDGVGKHHGDIRAYPPSSRVVFRDQPPTTRHRWNFNQDGDNLDKGPQNWFNRSPQVFWFPHERSHSEKPCTLTGCLSPNCSQTVESFDLYRHKENTLFQGENSSIGSSSLSHASAYMTGK